MKRCQPIVQQLETLWPLCFLGWALGGGGENTGKGSQGEEG